METTLLLLAQALASSPCSGEAILALFNRHSLCRGVNNRLILCGGVINKHSGVVESLLWLINTSNTDNDAYQVIAD